MTLNAAIDAWNRADRRTALLEMREVWSATRSPRIAALIRAVPEPDRPALEEGTGKKPNAAWHALATQGDPLDLPRLARSLLGGTSNQGIERLAALPDDPRLTSALVALLDDPPRSSQGSMPFWRAVLARLGELGEASVAPELARLGDGYASRIPTSVGEWLGNQCTKVGVALAKCTCTDPEDPALDTLEALLASELGTLVREDASHRNEVAREEDLLAAIYASPDSMAARVAYGDWLLEQGDPRGPWMRAQLDGDRSSPPEAMKPRVLGAIAGAVMTARFRDGFADTVWLWGSKAAIPKSIGRPEWATVTEMHIVGWPSASYEPDRPFLNKLRKLVSDPALTSLKRLSGPAVQDLQQLADAGRTLESVGLAQRIQLSDAPEVRVLVDALRPTHLALGELGEHMPAFLDQLDLGALRSLRLSSAMPLHALVTRFEPTHLETLVVSPYALHGALALTRDGDGHFSVMTLHRERSHMDWKLESLEKVLDGVAHVSSFHIADHPCRVGFQTPYDDTVALTPDDRAGIAGLLARFGVTPT
ncbi:MAG: TIGR02996 domain-containing protein [Myxococcota bacterium]